MITSTFTFKQLSVDGEFESLNERVERVAEAIDGYLGRTRWRGTEGLSSVTYYWRDMDALETFRKDATHRLAKSRYREWYAGFRVEIAEVLHVYGDGFLDDRFPTSND